MTIPLLPPDRLPATSVCRTLAIESQLVADGVPDQEIATVAAGFGDPLVPTGPNVGEPQNRRPVIDLGEGTTS
jgi:OmpA-OmpF porin, OOP family